MWITENKYEKVVTMANGAKIVSVKTDEEMAANAAKRKVAANKTATKNATAGQTTSRSKPAARSKQPPPWKRRKM